MSRTDSGCVSTTAASGLLADASRIAVSRSPVAPVGSTIATTACTSSSAASCSRVSRKARGLHRGGGFGRAAHLQAGAGGGVRGELAGAADVGHDGHRAPGRDGLGGQQRGRLDQLAEAAGGDDAGLLEQRLLEGCCFGQDGEDGHGAADPAGGPGELARVAERLQVEHGQPGLVVALPPEQHVVAGHVELVADRGERGDADAEPGQVVDQGEAEAAGLHDQAGHAGPGRAGGEGGVQAEAGHGHPEAVRADQAHVVAAADREEFGAVRWVQPGGDHDQGPHAALAALRGHLEAPAAAGTAITARSAGSGRSSAEARLGSPPTWAARGLTT